MNHDHTAADSEAWFRALSTSSPAGIFQADLDARVGYVNPRFEQIWGMSASEAMGMGWLERIHPEDVPHLFERWNSSVDQQGEYGADYRLRMPDGSIRHVHAQSGPLRNARGEVVGAVGTVTDVTEQRRIERALRESEERLRLAIGAAQMVAWELDLRSTWPVAYSEPTLSLSGATRQTFERYTDFLDSIHPDDRDRVASAVMRAVAVGEEFEDEFRVTAPDGAVRWRHARGRVTRGEDGAPERMIGVALDSTRTKAREEALQHRALHDPLTGLANRALFDERLARALEQAGGVPGGTSRQTAVLFVDLDGFKAVNDTLGHDAGDRLLCMVAGRLRGVTRGTDVVARLGGDEFAILLERVSDAGDATMIAERVVDVIGAPFPMETGQASVGASVGVTLARPGESDLEVARRADSAMYRAKGGGKGHFVLHR